jgi:hydroxymethylglutaryl-CoA lyase
MAPSVEIVEVGPRDGLQNDAALLSVDQKVEFIRRLAATGIARAEVASFVNPARVPQMAGAEQTLAGILDLDLRTIGLVLNSRGWARAAATKVEEVNLVVVSTDSFARANSGTDTEGTVRVAEEVAPLARAAGVRPTVTITTCFGCPFEGEVAIERIVGLAERCAAAGIDEISLADTIGVGVPAEVTRRVAAVRSAVGDAVALRAHFHNTRNTGYANAWAALEAGVVALDASVGGVGGCPFAPRATGNIATEDLVFMLERSGVRTGVDVDALIDVAGWLEAQLGRPVPSLLTKAGVFPPSEIAGRLPPVADRR